MRNSFPEGSEPYDALNKRLNGFAYSDCLDALRQLSLLSTHYPAPSLPKSNNKYQGQEY